MPPPEFNETLLIVFPAIPDREKDLDILFDLEIRMHELIDGSDIGTVDGNEIDMGEHPNNLDFTLFLYGINAEKLLEKVTPLLKTCPFTRKAYAILRRGLPRDWDEETKSKRVQLADLV